MPGNGPQPTAADLGMMIGVSFRAVFDAAAKGATYAALVGGVAVFAPKVAIQEVRRAWKARKDPYPWQRR